MDMKKTFREIDESKGFKWELGPDPSSLELWHMSILDTPTTELEIGDLCRAVRQGMYISELLPLVLSELDKDVLVGYWDDAELLKATSELSTSVWGKYLAGAKKMLDILRRDNESVAGDSYAVFYAAELERKLLVTLGDQGCGHGGE